MKKILFILAVIIFLPIVFTSCSDDDNPTPPYTGGGYFGMGNGSYWIYSNTYLDSNSNATLITPTDSISLEKDTVLLNVTSKSIKHRFVFPDNQSSNNGAYCLYEDGNKLYISSSFVSMFLPPLVQGMLGLVLDQSWYKIADGSSQSWKIDSIDIANQAIPGLPLDIAMNGVVNLLIEHSKDTIFAGKAVNAYKFKVEFDGSASTTDPTWALVISSIGKFNLVFAEVNFYFKQGEGLIGIYNQPMQLQIASKIPIPGIPSIPLMKTDGFKKELINSSIK